MVKMNKIFMVIVPELISLINPRIYEKLISWMVGREKKHYFFMRKLTLNV